MAHKDLRVSLTQLDMNSVSHGESAQAEIERIFIEVAQEIGMTDARMLLPGQGNEECTLVYDKFTPRRR